MRAACRKLESCEGGTTPVATWQTVRWPNAMSGHLTGFAWKIQGFLTWPWSIWPPEMAGICHRLPECVTIYHTSPRERLNRRVGRVSGANIKIGRLEK